MEDLETLFGDVKVEKLPVTKRLRPGPRGKLTGYRAYPHGKPGNHRTRYVVEVIMVIKPQPKVRFTMFYSYRSYTVFSMVLDPMRLKSFEKLSAKLENNYHLPSWYYFVAFILGFFWTHRNEK